MKTLNLTAAIITQNLQISEKQDTKLCVNALEQDPSFTTGHETTSLPITSNHMNILLVFIGLNNRYSIRNSDKESSLLYVRNFVCVCVLAK